MSITVNIQIQGFGERLELGPMSAQREQLMSWPPAKSPGQCARNKERTKDGTECLLPESGSPCKRRQEGLEKKELLPRGDCFQSGEQWCGWPAHLVLTVRRCLLRRVSVGWWEKMSVRDLQRELSDNVSGRMNGMHMKHTTKQQGSICAILPEALEFNFS